MKKQIVTITYPNWLLDHVPRFIELLFKSNPDAYLTVFVLLARDELDKQSADAVKLLVAEYEDEWKEGRLAFQYTQISDPYSPGIRNYLIPDLLRAQLLELLPGIHRLVYMDPDVDVVGSLDLLFDPENYKYVDVALCTNPAAAHMNGAKYNIGTILMNRAMLDIAAAVKRVYENDKGIWPEFCPGTQVWNEAVKSVSVGTLPYCYGTCPHHSPELIAAAKVLHFSGPVMKALRFMFDYSDFPNSIKLQLKKQGTKDEEKVG